MGCSCTVVICTYQMYSRDFETTMLRPTVYRPWHIDSRRKYRLLCIIRHYRRVNNIVKTPPKLLKTTTVAIQRVFLNTQWQMHCCLWIYTVGGLKTFQSWHHIIVSNACNEPQRKKKQLNNPFFYRSDGSMLIYQFQMDTLVDESIVAD